MSFTMCAACAYRLSSRMLSLQYRKPVRTGVRSRAQPMMMALLMERGIGFAGLLRSVRLCYTVTRVREARTLTRAHVRVSARVRTDDPMG